MNAPRILLVDDDTALLQALPHMVALRIHGVQVDTADSAIEALERIQTYSYDAIVSDIKMPGMDGLELLARIREIQPETPTILITGHMDPALMLDAIKNGAYDFIQKPIDRIYFVAALYRAIQTHHLLQKIRAQQDLLVSYVQVLERLMEQNPEEAATIKPLVESGKEVSPFHPPTWLIS